MSKRGASKPSAKPVARYKIVRSSSPIKQSERLVVIVRDSSKPSARTIDISKIIRSSSPSKPSARTVAVSKMTRASSSIKKRRYSVQRKGVSMKELRKILSNPDVLSQIMNAHPYSPDIPPPSKRVPDPPDTPPPPKRGNF